MDVEDQDKAGQEDAPSDVTANRAAVVKGKGKAKEKDPTPASLDSEMEVDNIVADVS